MRAGQRLAAVVIPDISDQPTLNANDKLLPIVPNDTIVANARTHGVPVWTLSYLPATLKFELLVVACFPHRLPQALLNRAKIAALNIHPSRLPAYRGPAPVFWQLRDGMREIGVTLHHMTSRIDAGDIIAQTDVTLPIGISGSNADALLANAGVHMLLTTIQSGDFSGQSQGSPASYKSWPCAKDWSVPTSWPVMHAFNFMRGVAEWEQSFTLLSHPKPLKVRKATDFTHDSSIPGAVRLSRSGKKEVGFADGWLQVC